jgi:hypothetical protein
MRFTIGHQFVRLARAIQSRRAFKSREIASNGHLCTAAKPKRVRFMEILGVMLEKACLKKTLLSTLFCEEKRGFADP